MSPLLSKGRPFSLLFSQEAPLFSLLFSTKGGPSPLSSLLSSLLREGPSLFSSLLREGPSLLSSLGKAPLLSLPFSTEHIRRRRRSTKGSGRARIERAQGLGTDIPLPHAAHSLSLECPSQRETAIQAPGSPHNNARDRSDVEAHSAAAAFNKREWVSSSAPKASALTSRYPTQPTAAGRGGAAAWRDGVWSRSSPPSPARPDSRRITRAGRLRGRSVAVLGLRSTVPSARAPPSPPVH